MAANHPAAYVQDLPPAGGFSPVQYKRNLPARGPSGAVLFAGMIGLCSYGWYWNIQSIRERRELVREKTWARIHLTPLLQAETDRGETRLLHQQEEQEKRVMANVADWDQKRQIYHTKRYVPPTILVAEDKWLNLF
ncbi:NADH:ubiquinone oxidoreductase 14kD subunit [Blastocladiella britannica]|nr:NADH:ubiquinone oxidoreductase 14kD subunit [Blastocladiella britannica]